MDGKHAVRNARYRGSSGALEQDHVERLSVGDLHHAGAHQVLYASDGYPGRIYKLSLDGKVLGVLGSSGHGPVQFGWIHELACPSENILYAAELLNWRVQKLTLEQTT